MRQINNGYAVRVHGKEAREKAEQSTINFIRKVMRNEKKTYQKQNHKG